MDRAHVTFDNGQEAEVIVRDIAVDYGVDLNPEVTIRGYLTRPNKRKHQVSGLEVTRVIYNDPATVVYWSDKTRTVVKCQPGDTYDPKTGFLLALCKKVCGNTGNYNDLLRECVPGYGKDDCIDYDCMRRKLDKFCRGHNCCNECPLHQPGFVCGRGKSFLCDKNDSGYMTDEEILKHYKATKKGEHNHEHE